MGILERVLEMLRGAGFRAETAFPGRKCSAITGPVAAVHIEKVDRAASQVTVAVSIHCPANMGGTACEEEGLRAVEVLHADGAACVLSGCAYDGMTRTYGVSILATFTGTAGAEECALGPGFRVYVGETSLPYAVSFTGEMIRENELRYAMGEAAPVGVSSGCGGWKITLVEQIPVGAAEDGDVTEPFTLRVERSTGEAEIYRSCMWTSAAREFTREGLKRAWTGISTGREVS